MLVSAKLVAPREFAYFGVASGLSTVIFSFNTLGLEHWLGTIAPTNRAKYILTAARFATLLTGIAVVIAVALFSYSTLAAQLLAFAAVTGLLLSANQFLSYTLVLAGLDRRLATLRLSQAAVNAALSVLLVIFWPDWRALAFSWAFSLAAGMGMSCGPQIVKGLREVARRHRPGVEPAVLRRLVGIQPLTSLISGFSTQSTSILLPSVVTALHAGQFALASRCSTAFVMLGVQVVQPLFYREFSTSLTHQDREPLGSYRRWITINLGWCVPSYVLLWFGLILLEGRLGPSWHGLSGVALPVCLASAAQAIVSPLTQGLLMLGGRVRQFRWEVSRAVAMISILLGLGHWLGDSLVIWLVAGVSVFAYGAHVVLTLTSPTPRSQLPA